MAVPLLARYQSLIPVHGKIEKRKPNHDMRFSLYIRSHPSPLRGKKQKMNALELISRVQKCSAKSLYIVLCILDILDIMDVDVIINFSIRGGLERDNLFHLLSQFFMYFTVYLYIYCDCDKLWINYYYYYYYYCYWCGRGTIKHLHLWYQPYLRWNQFTNPKPKSFKPGDTFVVEWRHWTVWLISLNSQKGMTEKNGVWSEAIQSINR